MKWWTKIVVVIAAAALTWILWGMVMRAMHQGGQ